MSKPVVNTSLLTLSLLLLLLAVLHFNKEVRSNKTSIEVSENKKRLSITAAYPKNMSEKVEARLRAYLDMNDLNNLEDMDLRDYTTPSRHMRFNIQTEDGQVKIWLDKRNNNRQAYAHLKKTGDVIKEVLIP
jgi:hypothetical protein